VHAYADPGSSARDRAFERLYRRYVSDVYRYTLALLRNPADAEDITQTTFLNAYRAYRRGEEPLKPHNWLIKIAHNACRTRYLRASRRPQEVPLEDNLRELAVPTAEIPNVQEVLDALAKLPFNQRAALVMRELEGRSYTEIAQALEVTVPAVETLIFRARRALRIRRSALKTLAALPLPGSLSSFSGGTAAVGGGALVGSGLLLKAVVAIGVGVVAGTAGTAVEAKDIRAGTVDAQHEPPLTVELGRIAGRGSAQAARAGSIFLYTARSGAGRVSDRSQAQPGHVPRRDGVTKASSVADASPGAVSSPVNPSGPASTSSLSPPSPAAALTERIRATAPTPAVPATPVQTPAIAVPATPTAPVSAPPPPAAPSLPPPPPLPPPPSLP
jgi:RNA polymerase sigma factor (sigma-70 family)